VKLFSRYSRVNLLATILVLIVGSLCYYVIIRYVLIRQLDDTLRVEEAEILDYARQKGRLPEPANYKDQLIRFEPAGPGLSRHFQSRQLFVEPERERKPYRQLVFPVEVNGQVTRVTVSKSQVETEDLLWLIVLITVGVIVLLLLIQFILNRYLLRRIWTPFYGTLAAIRKFNLQSREPMERNRSDIDEFASLDQAVGQMTGKIITDYQTLKDFADNASHEMQTPLAVINSRLDLLLQEQGLDESRGRHLQAMYDAVSRMSRLNQSLLLLTKIGNDQFNQDIQVPMHDLVRSKLAQLEEMAEARQLKVSSRIDEVFLVMDPYLADILLNNLLTNSIRHNVNGGEIHVDLSPGSLVIANSGLPLAFPPARIFDRFVKSGPSEGTGLGLAIVLQICEKYGYAVQYAGEGERHRFSILF
jgi:signal transduction histidine kinase